MHRVFNEAHGLLTRTGTSLINSHIYRNAHQCANHLAHLRAEQNDEMVLVLLDSWQMTPLGVYNQRYPQPQAVIRLIICGLLQVCNIAIFCYSMLWTFRFQLNSFPAYPKKRAYYLLSMCFKCAYSTTFTDLLFHYTILFSKVYLYYYSVFFFKSGKEVLLIKIKYNNKRDTRTRHKCC